jgi:quinol monooxygenase YgiN
MTTLVILDAPTKGGNAAELSSVLRELLPGTRSFVGCHKVSAHLSQDGKTMMLVEEWDSRQAYEKYSAWRVTTDIFKQLVAQLAGPANIRFFDPLDG